LWNIISQIEDSLKNWPQHIAYTEWRQNTKLGTGIQRFLDSPKRTMKCQRQASDDLIADSEVTTNDDDYGDESLEKSHL
jgi:hypothetical protein